MSFERQKDVIRDYVYYIYIFLPKYGDCTAPNGFELYIYLFMVNIYLLLINIIRGVLQFIWWPLDHAGLMLAFVLPKLIVL